MTAASAPPGDAGSLYACLDLPGQWQDGWLHGEHLLLWDRDGQLHACPGVTSLPGGPPPDPVAVACERVPGHVLDVAACGEHVWVASTGGLFELRVARQGPALASPLLLRLAARARAVAAGHQAVIASAGERLWLFPPLPAVPGIAPEALLPRLIASPSQGCAMLDAGVLNYAGGPFPDFLRADGHGGYEAPASTAPAIRAALALGPDPGDGRAEVLAGAGATLLAAVDGALRAVTLTAGPPGQELRATAASGPPHPPGEPPRARDVMSLAALDGALILDLLDEVRLVTPVASITLAAEPAACVRAFPRPAPAPGIVVAILEERASVFSVRLPAGGAA